MAEESKLKNFDQENARLESKLFSKTGFVLGWMIFLAVVLFKVTWPLRNMALVCWVYGWEAYSRTGLYVMPGKPSKFSNGEPVPVAPDLISGFAAFFVTTPGLTLVLVVVLRLYERIKRSNKNRFP